MRHKYIIFALTGVLILLLILKVNEPTKYPISIKYEWGKESKIEKLANKFLEDRPLASENAIKWDSFHIGDTKEIVQSHSQYTTDSTIVLEGNTFPCETTYFYGQDGNLIELHISFSTLTNSSTKNLTEKIYHLYGDHYFKVTFYSLYESYFWLDGDNLVIYEDHSIDSFLCVTDVSGLSNEQLAEFIRSGHINNRLPRMPHIQSFLSEK